MKAFQREDRYIVLKRKHLASLPNELQYRLKPALEDAAQLMPALECVVVESDWPEHDTVWRMIEARVNGTDQVSGQMAGPDAELVGGLLELLIESRELISRGEFDTGVCCCGGDVDKHGFGDGHSPINEGGYYAGSLMNRIDKALSGRK